MSGVAVERKNTSSSDLDLQMEFGQAIELEPSNPKRDRYLSQAYQLAGQAIRIYQ